MTFLKKCLSSITLSAMAATLFVSPTQAALDFTDNSEIPSWAEEAIEELMDQGVISGNDDGSFAPNRQLNRAEVSKIIILATGIDLDTTGGPHFPDVDEGAWYYDYIETMYNQGWINGYPDGEFRPGVGINRAEIAKMVVNAFEIDQDLAGAPHFDDVSDADWFYGYVETAYNNGLMRGYGDGSFGPANAVTRAETAKIVYDSQLVVLPTPTDTEGTLEVVLSEDTPRGTNIPFNATSVPFTTVELTASDDSDVEISSLTFTRLGLGDNDDFDNVWLEIDGFKVGNDKSINNDDVVELRFNPPIVVPAGQTIVADVVSSTKYVDTVGQRNVGHHNRLALVSADDIVSTAANIAGDFPIEGEEMEVAEYEVSQLKFSRLGSDATVDVGDNFIEIGKFRMLNASNTNKDIELRAITFKNDGTAEIEDSLENVALYVSGEQVSAESIIDGDYVTFRLDNGVTGGYIIEDGDSRIFSMRADIVSAEKSDSINFKVDNFEDIVGVEIGTAFGVKAVGNDSTGLTFTSGDPATTAADTTTCVDANAEDRCARLRAYSIDSGDLNISRDPASLGNQQYAPGSNDVVFLTARVVVDQPLIVDGVRIDVASVTSIANDTNLDAYFDNFRLFLNDKLIDSENDFTDGATTGATDSYLDFQTTFEIAGTSIMKVVGNLTDSAATGAKVKLEVENTAFTSPEYISTGDQVTTSQVLGSAQGSFVEVNVSELIITRTDGFSADDKIVAGVDDVTFLKFVLDNNDSGDVNIASVTIDGTATGKARTEENFTVAVFVDGTQQGSSKNLDSSGDATFNDLSVVIPSAGQKEFEVVVDTIEASATSFSETLTVGVDMVDGVVDGGDHSAGAVAGEFVRTTEAFASALTIGDTVTLVKDTTAGGGSVEVVVVYIDTDATDPAGTHSNTNFAVDNATADDGFDAANVFGFSVADGTLTEAQHTVADGSPSATLKHTLQLDISDVDADNVENGQTVTVKEGGTALSTTNKLAGVAFELVQSGRLTTNIGTTVYSDLLVANSSDVEVLKVRFNASDDEIQIKDLYFVNDFEGTLGAPSTDEIATESRVSFKLYNEDGQLIQEKQMTGGKLHFELANQDRIRVPKDESATVTVKVDVRDITKANQTGNRLKLKLNTSLGENGISAVTAATGSDIATANMTANSVNGELFVAHRTQVSVRHASTQPSFADPTTASQEVYRFTATADQARQAELGRVSLKVDLSGMDEAAAGTTFIVRQVKDDGTVDDTATVTSSVTDDFDGTGSDKSGVVTIDFSNQKLAKGESRTYALFMDNTEDVGGEADDDSVSVTILRDTNYTKPEAKAGNDLALTGATIDVAGTALAAGENPASANIVMGGETIAVDVAVAATNAAIATTIAAAIDGNAKFSASASGTTVTVTASDGATTSTINTTALVTAIDTADVSDNDTTLTSRTGARLLWSDESSTSHSTTTADWMNGYLVEIDTTAKVNQD